MVYFTDSALQMNSSRTVFYLEGHAEILRDTACQVQPAIGHAVL